MTPRIAAAVLGAAHRYAVALPTLDSDAPARLRAITAQVCGASCERVAVVLGSNAGTLAPKLAGLPVALETNVLWSEGLASSIRAAVAWALRSGADALLLVPGDLPRVTTLHLERLLASYRRARTLVASRTGKVLDLPAVFDRAQFARLGNLSGDCSAKLVIGTTARIAGVDWRDGAVGLERGSRRAIDDVTAA